MTEKIYVQHGNEKNSVESKSTPRSFMESLLRSYTFVTHFAIAVKCITFFRKDNDSRAVSIEFRTVSSTPNAYGIIVR